MRVQILHNGRGRGDRVEITVGGALVFEGYHPNPAELVNQFKSIPGQTGVEYHSVTDEELDNRGYLVGGS